MIGQTNKKIRSGKLQRTLRNNLSDAEQALWHLLRGRQICGLTGVCPEGMLRRRDEGARYEW